MIIPSFVQGNSRDLQESQFGCSKEIFKFARSRHLSGWGNASEKMGLCCQETLKIFAPEQEKIGIRTAQLPTLYLSRHGVAVLANLKFSFKQPNWDS